MAATYVQSGDRRRSKGGPRAWPRRADRAVWRRFLLALLALALSLFLALYATSIRQSGRYLLGAAIATIALVMAGLVAASVVPYLARRTTLSRWMTRVEFKFTREGAVYLALTAVITVAALNTGNNLLFIVLACLLAGMVASGILSRLMLAGLEMELALPEHIFQEQPAAARLRLTNLKGYFASFSLTLSVQAAPLQRRPNSGGTPNPPALKRTVYVPYLPHHASVNPSLELTFPSRGRYSQEGVRISTQFPFGFLRKTRTMRSQPEVLVLPKVQPTEKFREILPFIGSEVESYLKGRGHDLYAIRDYQQTDTARHVDWKATAKAQQLKVREFAREDERRLGLVFDRRIPDGRDEMLERFEKAVFFCACVAWHFSEAGALMRFATEGFETPISPAAEVIYPILENLATIEPALEDAAGAENLFADPHRGMEDFQIVFTCRPRRSIPAAQWTASYFIFMDEL
ncbi:MAG TPA: DUF58 domain-containing protein [Terriglobia bacterium]|nr:DUF58 domain-containing protein [Terriglobia bacterium]